MTAGDAVLARLGVVVDLGRGANPHDAVALRRRPRRFDGVPDLVGIAPAAAGPARGLGPGRVVVDDPVPKHRVFFAGGGQHGQEPAPVAVDVVHVVAGGELAVGDVEEVAASEERDQVVPGFDVGAVVDGVAVGHPIGDRHRPVGGHGEDPHQLFQVGAVVLGMSPRDLGGPLAAPRAPVRVRVRAGELDRR